MRPLFSCPLSTCSCAPRLKIVLKHCPDQVPGTVWVKKKKKKTALGFWLCKGQPSWIEGKGSSWQKGQGENCLASCLHFPPRQTTDRERNNFKQVLKQRQCWKKAKETHLQTPRQLGTVVPELEGHPILHIGGNFLPWHTVFCLSEHLTSGCGQQRPRLGPFLHRVLK